MKRFLRRCFFYYGAFLLVDWVVTFKLDFLLVVDFLFILQQPIERLKNTYVKSRFIYIRENFDSPFLAHIDNFPWS